MRVLGGSPPRPVTERTLGLVAYRFRTTLHRRWGAYLTVVVLVGLIGGLAMASVAGGRRTGSSYDTYLANTNPSDLQLFTGYDSPSVGSDNGYDPAVIRKVDHLPMVKGAATLVGFDGNLEQLTGVHRHQTAGESPAALVGSPDGLFATEDRVQVLEGRLADRSGVNEAVVNRQAADELGVHVGSVIHLGLATDAEENTNTTIAPAELRRVTVTIVGVVQFNDEVIEDQVDTLGGGFVVLTPTLTRQLDTEYATYSSTFLQLTGGGKDDAAVVAEAAHLLPSRPRGRGGPHRVRPHRRQGRPHPAARGHRPRGIRPAGRTGCVADRGPGLAPPVTAGNRRSRRPPLVGGRAGHDPRRQPLGSAGLHRGRDGGGGGCGRRPQPAQPGPTPDCRCRR